MSEHEIDDVVRRLGNDERDDQATVDRLVRRLDADLADPSAGPKRVRRSGWPRMRLPVLVTVSTLAVVGVAAASGLLATGDPVPNAPTDAGFGEIVPGTTRVVDTKTPDPDGGPGWGLLIYGLKPSQAGLPKGIVSTGEVLVCAAPARLQDGQVGVVGRDGVFKNDGKFHALAPESRPSPICGSPSPGGAVFADAKGPAVSASGYTGPVPSSVGGCRERLQSRSRGEGSKASRKLLTAPVCETEGLRTVRAGFAGPEATKVVLSDGTNSDSASPDRHNSGAYLFVLRPSQTDEDHQTLTVTFSDGSTCAHSSQPKPIDQNCSRPPGF